MDENIFARFKLSVKTIHKKYPVDSVIADTSSCLTGLLTVAPDSRAI